MKKIFIWFGTWPEQIIFHQATLLYNFFLINGYTLVKEAKLADVIFLCWYPFNNHEETRVLLTLNYYLKKYPNTDIIAFWHLADMIQGMNEFWKLKVIWLYQSKRINTLFPHTIPIEEIHVENYRFFIPLKIDNLYIWDFWYDISIKTNYILREDEINISINTLRNWEISISWIEEYEEKYCYLEDKTNNIYIQTSYGCAFNCSYCVINSVWWVISRPMDEILKQIQKWIEAGKKSVYIVDQDSGSYGIDIWLDFADLLNKINKIPWDFDIRIYYFEPSRFLKLYKKINVDILTRRLAFLNIPIQTTSQRILTLMNRNYDITEVLNIIRKLRRINMRIRLETIVMYGFPTETYDEFMEYPKILPYFDHIEFLRYSERPWTKSVKLWGKILYADMEKRFSIMWKLKEKFPTKIDYCMEI